MSKCAPNSVQNPHDKYETYKRDVVQTLQYLYQDYIVRYNLSPQELS